MRFDGDVSALNIISIQAELDLFLQIAAMEALRLLARTGRMDSFTISSLKNGALKIAFSEVVKDCVDEKRQRQNERTKV